MKLTLPKLQKKHIYLVYSCLAVFSLVVVSYSQGQRRVIASVAACLIIVVGAYFTQATLITLQNAVTIFLLPAHLVAGTLLSLYYFPNLGLPTKMGALISVGIIIYIVSLMNNIFLIVEQKGSLIPLYRVALTWCQILLVIIAIPFFAGIFKMPINSFFQNLIAALSTFFFSFYMVHVQSFDTFTRKTEVGGRVMYSLLSSFIVFSLGLCVSFLPTKSFLRALFVSSVLMGVLGYMQSNIRNDITRKAVIEYCIISITFLFLALIF
jgi:hypothetical protein